MPAIAEHLQVVIPAIAEHLQVVIPAIAAHLKVVIPAIAAQWRGIQSASNGRTGCHACRWQAGMTAGKCMASPNDNREAPQTFAFDTCCNLIARVDQ
jgi:hypothetical protein